METVWMEGVIAFLDFMVMIAVYTNGCLGMITAYRRSKPYADPDAKKIDEPDVEDYAANVPLSIEVQCHSQGYGNSRGYYYALQYNRGSILLSIFPPRLFRGPFHAEAVKHLLNTIKVFHHLQLASACPVSQGFFYSRTGNQGPACQFPSVKSCGLWCYCTGCNLKR
ncbi:unnamed protein product, partial [Vitis vinifera]